jgi:hypothetical protein
VAAVDAILAAARRPGCARTPTSTGSMGRRTRLPRFGPRGRGAGSIGPARSR